MAGRMWRKGRGGRTTGREQIKFPPWNSTVAERKTEKNDKEGGEAGRAASSKYC